MVHQPALLAIALACVVAAVIWGRSTLRQERAWRRLTAAAAEAAEEDDTDIAVSERAAANLARSAFRKELHSAIFYIVVATCAVVGSFSQNRAWTAPFFLVLIPVAITYRYGGRFLDEAHVAEERSLRVRKAEQAL